MPEISNVQIQELPPTPTRLANKDTGFPEPLSTERNTTLHHPDADTSQGASIEGPEISLTRTHSRKISFLSHKRKQSGASGKINPADYESPEGAGLYDNIQYEDGSHEKKGTKTLEQEVQKRDDIVDAPDVNSDGELEPVDERDEQGYKDGERRKGVLRKVHLHKV